MDLRDKIESQEGSFQRLASVLPGFSGYHELGTRRAADKLVRDHLVGLMDDLVKRMQQVLLKWTEAKQLDLLDDLDRLLGRVRKARDGLRYADYGYTGWWDAAKIKEAELDAMYAYDLKMREEIVSLDAAVQELAGADQAALAAKMAVVQEQVEQLQSAIDHRGEMIAGLVP